MMVIFSGRIPFKINVFAARRGIVQIIMVMGVILLVACSSTDDSEPPTQVLFESTSAPVSTILPSPSPEADEEDPFAARRKMMVQNGIIGWGIEDEKVIEVMGIVPRHEFVPENYLSQAYDNHPLPIGYGQTISQPYIVALMTQASGAAAGHTVLEIGTGSGYQASVLAQLADHVYTMEIIGPLAERAEASVNRVGYDNITVRHADGYFGWEEHAPYDAIVVTAAPDHIPQPLVEQLKIGGRMVIPVGPIGGVQTLWLIIRDSEDQVRTENLGAVRFVPFTRE